MYICYDSELADKFGARRLATIEQADRRAPMHGMPGEYDTSVCDRFAATTFTDDVTCIRCKRSVEKQR